MVFSIKNSLALVAIVGTIIVLSAAETNHCAARGIHQCTLTPEEIEGPYFILDTQYRSNLTEDRTGVPFGVDIVVQNTKTCAPVEGLIVQLWSADALGVYSGFKDFEDLPNNGPPNDGPEDERNTPIDEYRFLRGYQITDSDGNVHFDLIIPGWYVGRCVHIHIETFLPDANGGDNQTIHTTQAYFPNELILSFQNKSSYIDNPNEMQLNEQDDVFQSQRGAELIMDIQPVSDNPDKDGYSARIVLGIDIEISDSAASSLNASLVMLFILIKTTLMIIL